MLNKHNIVLVGFMGTGKTTLAKQVAARLNWQAVDSDEWIETKEGMSIPDIFAQKGEAYFRQVESEALQTILKGKKQVVATGGGAVLSAHNCDLMLAQAVVIALQADQTVIVDRISHDPNRPLVQGDAEKRVAALMAERQHAYDFAHMSVDTGKLTLAEATEQIMTYCQPYIR